MPQATCCFRWHRVEKAQRPLLPLELEAPDASKGAAGVAQRPLLPLELEPEPCVQAGHLREGRQQLLLVHLKILNPLVLRSSNLLPQVGNELFLHEQLMSGSFEIDHQFGTSLEFLVELMLETGSGRCQ